MKSHPQPVNSSLLRQLNCKKILGALRHHGPISRADLVRLTRISGPTVTRTVAELVEARLIEEGDLIPVPLGRPRRTLHLARRESGVIGVAIGALECEVILAGLDGSVDEVSLSRFATPADYDSLINRLAEAIRQVQDISGRCIHGIGLSLPGLLDRRDMRTMVSPNLHQTDGRQVGRDLERLVRIEVAVLSEKYSMCLAEAAFGGARNSLDFAVLDISDGLGLGVVLAGNYLLGHQGMAGELGHVIVDPGGHPCGCGKQGCLETVATDRAFLRQINLRTHSNRTLEETFEQIRLGKIDPARECEQIISHLSRGLGMVINLFNPEKIFIYGRCLDAMPTMFQSLIRATEVQAMSPMISSCKIIRAKVNKRLGAVATIIHHLLAGPEGPLAVESEQVEGEPAKQQPARQNSLPSSEI